MTQPGSPPSTLSRRSLLGAGAGTFALSLLGCGGDSGGSAGVGSGGTGSFSSGPIRGFGSILVGGIHYDEQGAEIFDDAGRAIAQDGLRLGRVVDVSGSDITTDAHGKSRARADIIAVRSEIEGPISWISEDGATLTVLGQAVIITPRTAFDDVQRGELRVGDIVEVSGFLQGDGVYTATCIELEDDDEGYYKLRGVIHALDTGARTFQIGDALVSWDSATARPATLANGDHVRVELDVTPDAAGRWRASDIRVKSSAFATSPAKGAEAEIEGVISGVSVANSTFTLLGITVDYSRAVFEDGTAADLAAGVQVEVEGRMSADGTVLVAKEVEFEFDDDDDDDDAEFEIEGVIAEVLSPNAFVVHGVVVEHDARTKFEDGSAANLRRGVKVEIKGHLAADGATLIATEIEFDD